MSQTQSAASNNFFLKHSIQMLPARMKRLVFLASLTAIAKNTKIPEEHLISKLNSLLNLSSTGDAALKFPIHISQLIWANKEIFKNEIQTLTEEQTETYEAVESAVKIVDATPGWFRYADKEVLIKDLLSLFINQKGVFGMQAA